MKENYGNSFNSSKVDTDFGRVPIWIMVDEFLPVGGYIAVSETYPVGTKIPAGTPISVDKVGGTVTLNGTAPQGLTYEDAYVGTDGCTLTIVGRGQLNESLSEATYTSTQKTALKGRISFIVEA